MSQGVKRWPGMSQGVKRLVSSHDICQKNRALLGKHTKWLEAYVWKRIHMDLAHITEQGKRLLVDDAGSGWIEPFRTNDRTTLTVMKCR